MEFKESHAILGQSKEVDGKIEIVILKKISNSEEEKNLEAKEKRFPIRNESRLFFRKIKDKLLHCITSKETFQNNYEKNNPVITRFIKWMIFSNIIFPILYYFMYSIFSFIAPIPICEGNIIVDSNGTETLIFMEKGAIDDVDESVDEFGCSSNPNFFEFTNNCISNEKFLKSLSVSICQLMCICVNLIITSLVALNSIRTHCYPDDESKDNLEGCKLSAELSECSTIKSIMRDNIIIEDTDIFYLCFFRKLLIFICFIVMLLIYSSIILEIPSIEFGDTLLEKIPIFLIVPLVTFIFTQLLTPIGKFDLWEDSVYFLRLMGSSSFYLLNVILLFAFVKNVFNLVLFNIHQTEYLSF
uniref:Uncharacterized protein n=1 Tax=Strongyloides papillosus TaxID=174720 RepID=A0A0N5C315_STREA